MKLTSSVTEAHGSKTVGSSVAMRVISSVMHINCASLGTNDWHSIRENRQMNAIAKRVFIVVQVGKEIVCRRKKMVHMSCVFNYELT